MPPEEPSKKPRRAKGSGAVRKLPSGRVQAIVRRAGQPIQSKTFKSKVGAEEWLRSIGNEMDRGIFVSRAESERTTFKTAAERYIREVLPDKRGREQDEYRVKRLIEEFGAYSLAGITSSMIAAFRDHRLKYLAPQSVVHDLNMLNRIFRTATMDWGIALPAGIPTASVRKPSVNNERTRRLVGDEERRLFAAIDDPGPSPGKRRNVWIGPVVQFALETAARQSEILSLDWKDVDLRPDHWVARLRGTGGRATKNDDTYRDVPLSEAAVATLEGLQKGEEGKVVQRRRGKVFATTASAIKQSWERAVARARDTYEREVLLEGLTAYGMSEKEAQLEIRKVKPSGGRMPAKVTPPRKETQRILAELKHDPLLIDLHFHDLRHEATTRLAEKFQLQALMKVTGHKGTRMLARYYHPRAEDLAKILRRNRDDDNPRTLGAG